MDVLETTLQVNKFARRNRHLKVFSKWNLLKIHALDSAKFLAKPLILLKKTALFGEVMRYLISAKTWASDFLPVAPQKRLLSQAGLIAGIALIMSSFSAGGTFTAVSMSYATDYISAYSLPGDILVADEEGYLIKINPQTNNSNRIGMTDYALHTVESGETLSRIAARYGVAVSTIMWENNLYNAHMLKIGQKLLIPPVNGVSYTVASGDNLEKIANKYNISVSSIIAQNALGSETIYQGQKLFLPGAESARQTAVAATGTSPIARGVTYTASSAAPAGGAIFIFPTSGQITQSYRAGHYAIDIADTSRPAVWAGGSGTVTKASSGTWGGGYGNHIIIDHGDGLQTLYAHLQSLNVYEGQFVSQGNVIGIMGNTGRVYGSTGIHLHWEVIKNGVKQNPVNYY